MCSCQTRTGDKYEVDQEDAMDVWVKDMRIRHSETAWGWRDSQRSEFSSRCEASRNKKGRFMF
jgi:hypothetical protein